MAKPAKIARHVAKPPRERRLARPFESGSPREPPLRVADESRKTWEATAAKNRFGELLKVSRQEPVFIEKHGRAEAVILSMERYGELLQAATAAQDERLNALRQEFHALYAQMQSSSSRKAVERMSLTSPSQMVEVLNRSGR